MKWTKAHSQNAVASKERKRMSPPDFKKEVRIKVLMRRAKAKWRIQIRDLEHGGSLTLCLYKLPWPARYATQDGTSYSAAQLANILRHILTQAP